MRQRVVATLNANNKIEAKNALDMLTKRIAILPNNEHINERVEVLDDGNKSCDLQFIKHFRQDSWGLSTFVMESKGKAFGRLYTYHDDCKAAYLEGLNVNIECRKQGIGTKLLKTLEQIGEDFGAEYLCLWVEKDSWTYEWYRRNGYCYFKDHMDDKKSVWMKKVIPNNQSLS